MAELRTPVKTVLRVVAAIAICLAVLFIPAGTVAWPEAWALLAFYLGFVVPLLFWMKKRDPDLYRERSAKRKEGKPWDKILVSLYTIFLLLMLVAAGLDAVRFHLSRMPLAVKLIGFAGLLPIPALYVSIFKANTFASDVVRIQKDRGHRVVRSGPYRIVRHPMYAAVCFLVICIPLALGSWYALIFSGLIVMVFVVRTYLEDKTLQRELPGYAEYAGETRFRLVPGLW